MTFDPSFLCASIMYQDVTSYLINVHMNATLGSDLIKITRRTHCIKLNQNLLEVRNIFVIWTRKTVGNVFKMKGNVILRVLMVGNMYFCVRQLETFFNQSCKQIMWNLKTIFTKRNRHKCLINTT